MSRGLEKAQVGPTTGPVYIAYMALISTHPVDMVDGNVTEVMYPLPTPSPGQLGSSGFTRAVYGQRDPDNLLHGLNRQILKKASGWF